MREAGRAGAGAVLLRRAKHAAAQGLRLPLPPPPHAGGGGRLDVGWRGEELFVYFVEITKGKGHLTRMQAVLKAYVEAKKGV